MLGASGMIAPEILGKAGLIPAETGLNWFSSGLIGPAGEYGHYWTDPWSLFWIEVGPGGGGGHARPCTRVCR